ncbi:IS4 family transposase [Azospirillum brasilense]|uniref:IS4 family transposase n=1 Tax=Azospirillum brasilense TaxID=192 RepID=A0A560BW98_AZOBR|nr:IS4 family transposase [Azospirillum brasilense]
MTTKILAVVDAPGNFGRFILLPGQRHDSVGVEPVLEGIEFSALLADKAFDSNAIRALVAEREAVAVIPSKADRSAPIPHDTEMYKWRHLVENFFCKIKEFRRIATRYDRSATNFMAAVHIVATVAYWL